LGPSKFIKLSNRMHAKNQPERLSIHIIAQLTKTLISLVFTIFGELQKLPISPFYYSSNYYSCLTGLEKIDELIPAKTYIPRHMWFITAQVCGLLKIPFYAHFASNRQQCHYSKCHDPRSHKHVHTVPPNAFCLVSHTQYICRHLYTLL